MKMQYVRRHLNDRQRTILGLVTVFSLVGIALLSLMFMDKTSDSVTVLGSGQEAIVSQTDAPVIVEDSPVKASLDGNKLTIKADTTAPAVSVIFVYNGKQGQLAINDKQITSNSVVGMGEMTAGAEKTLQLNGIKGPVAVSVGGNGFTFPVTVSGTL